jgi:uncharacterized protein
MSFSALPAAASWRHEGLREGFEVAFFSHDDRGLRIEGATTAVEDGEPWIVSYVIELDVSWLTRSARITRRSRRANAGMVITADGSGGWQIDGKPAPELQGCLDLDLEASAMTNTFPVHRLDLPDGGDASVPAAYVRAVVPAVDRLEQTYSRVGERHYRYAAPAFDFECRLLYDRHGLILDYPGIATRVL